MITLALFFVFIISLLVLLIVLIQNYFTSYDRFILENTKKNEETTKHLKPEKASSEINDVFEEVMDRRLNELNQKFDMEESENSPDKQDVFSNEIIKAIKSSLKLLNIKT